MNKTIKTVLFATVLLTLVGVSASFTQAVASPSESIDEFASAIEITTSSSTAVHKMDTVQIADSISVEMNRP